MLYRIVFISLFLCLIAGGIGYLFWQQELQYSLPTPKPKDYVAVAQLEAVLVRSRLPKPGKGKALMLHFFNPSCPCSRFNSKHFASLYRQYSQQLQFMAIVPAYTSKEEAAEYLPEGITIVQDEDEAIAKACGAYSSPQAVLITADDKLYYRGNYNKSRYCTLPGSNYAEMALQDLVAGKPPKAFGQLATTAYGCSLSAENQLNSLLSF